MSLGRQAGVLEGRADAGDGAAAVGMAVGDAEGVGRRAVAGDLGVDRGARAAWRAPALRGPACRRLRPARSRRGCRSNGRDALAGSSLRVDRAVSRLKPVTPNGWIMLCEPPESMTSASPWRISSVRLADGLAAGGTGGQAVVVRPFEVEVVGQVAGVVCSSCSNSRPGWKLAQAARGEGRAYRPSRLSGR